MVDAGTITYFRSCFAILVIIVVSMSPVAQGRAEFRDKIPNGYNVKDANGLIWPGVGHNRAEGGGARNPFGLDFAAAGFEWTQTLCRMDSDGDGDSNGVELGDPDCIWKPGAKPAGPAISHPGFPGRPQGIIDTCQAFDEPAGAHDLIVQFTTPFLLPTNKVTTYPRQGFNLTSLANWVPGQDHFAIRFEPIYAGPVEVVHHISLYWCSLPELTKNGYLSGKPLIKKGGTCSEGLLYAWNIAFCLPAHHAIRLFRRSPYVMLEVHLDNAKLLPGIYARPGFRITVVPENAITPANPMLEANWLNLNMDIAKLRIPPGQGYVELTSNFTLPPSSGGSMTIFASASHMHWLGRKIWVERISPVHAPQSLSCNPTYNNMIQEVIPMRPPIQVTSEDMLVLHCVYNSSGRSNVTKGGTQTSDEMCGVFLLFQSDVWQNPMDAPTTPELSLTPQTTAIGCDVPRIVRNSTIASRDSDTRAWPSAHDSSVEIGFSFVMLLGALLLVLHLGRMSMRASDSLYREVVDTARREYMEQTIEERGTRFAKI